MLNLNYNKMRRKEPKREFKITIKSASLPEKEKKEMLFRALDILLSEKDILDRSNRNKK